MQTARAGLHVMLTYNRGVSSVNEVKHLVQERIAT